MPTVFVTLTALLQKIHNQEGNIATEGFLDVCRHIIPITGKASSTTRRRVSSMCLLDSILQESWRLFVS